MANPPPVICVDGPSGSGKGTLARAIAKKLDWNILDSGSLYRIVGLYAYSFDVSVEDDDALKQVVESLDIQFASERRPNIVAVSYTHLTLPTILLV